MLIFVVQEIGADTITVDDDGGADFEKIQDAINASGEGDTVRVYAGTYNENVRVNKAVNLIGNGSEDTTIDGGESGDVVKITADWVNMSGFLVTGSGGSTFSGIKVESDHNHIFKNDCLNNSEGIYLQYSRGCTIENNTFENNSIGIRLFNTANNTVESNNCSNNPEHGIYLQDSSACTIENNTCYSNTGNGIWLRHSDNNSIMNNNCSNNIEFGIYLWHADNNSIKNNNCSNNNYGIYLRSSSHCEIMNNTCWSNIKRGIYLSSSSHCIINNNTCLNNERGISLSSSDYCTISFNTCLNNEEGIRLDGSDYCTISFNTCLNNEEGIRLDGSDYCTISFNICLNNEKGIYLDSRDCIINNNTCSNNDYGIDLSSSHNSKVMKNSFSNNEYGIFLHNAINNTITSNTISENRIGIYLEISSWDNTACYNNIYNNTNYGINVNDNNDYTIIATYNWWGNASGPYHPDENPEGTGDNVSDYVEFDPWLGRLVGEIMTFYVDDDAADGGNGSLEKPYNKIQDAVNASENWDIVRVFAGTYYENVRVNKAVNLIGNGSELNTIDGGGNGDVVKITADWVNMNGFRVTGSGITWPDAGISIESNHNILSNNNCSNSGTGINLRYSSDCTITNNTCENNTYSSNSGSGISFLFSSNCTITNNTCENNDHGIWLYESSTCTLTNNTCSSNNRNGIYLRASSQDNMAHYNNIFNNTEYGINASNNNGYTINARNNWWGHPSGPYHSTLNPDGIGNEVSDYVNFYPWLSRPIDFRIHHVAPDGNDTTGTGSKDNPYRTIQKAIDMANEWDMIKVSVGVYSESITINKRNVNIIGDSPSTTILNAGGATTACMITVDDVEINGFTIRNATDNGILFVNSWGVKIINCVFPDNSYDMNLTNSRDNQLINTTFETVHFSDPNSSISVFWPVDLKVVDNRSGFIPNAHLKLTDTFGTTIFDGYTDDTGKIPQILCLEYDQSLSSQIDFNPYTISIWKDGYLDFAEELTITSYTPVTCELQTHILPVAIISEEILRNVDMDSEIFFDGTQSTGRSITYSWEFGDTSSSTSPTPSHIYTAPGAYHVNLTVTDDYENTSTASIIVIVKNVEPVIVTGVEKNSAFEDEPIVFDASFCWDTPSDSLSFNWDFGDGVQTEESVASHAFQSEGYFMVTLTITDRHGCKNTSTHYITVTNNAPWDVSAGEDISTYVDHAVEFNGSAKDTISDIGSLKYSWDLGDGMKAMGQNVTHVYSESGVYEVNLTVTDNNGASAYAWVNVTAKDPEILVSVSSYQIFHDETVFFNASHELDDGSFVYTWHFGDGYSADEKNVSHTFNKVGIFTPLLIVNDGMENTSVFLPEITVQNVVPVPAIQADKLQVIEDETVQFHGSGSLDSPSDLSMLSYSWDFGDGSNSVGIEVIHAFSDLGNYKVVLTVNDGKNTSTTEVNIEVQNLPPVADSGTPNERKATVDEPVILDASGTTDTPSDIPELNYTWKIGNETVYGEIVSYTFSKPGEFTVTLIVRDNNGETSEDTITFQVSKESESDDAAMNTISWILVVVIVVFLVVIGFLISVKRDEALYKELKAEEEAIVVEGEIDEESFKPKDDVTETIVEVDEVQDVEMTEAEVGVGEGEMDDDMFKPKGDDQESRVEVVERQEVEVSDEDIEVVKEPEIVSEEMDDVGKTEERTGELMKQNI